MMTNPDPYNEPWITIFIEELGATKDIDQIKLFLKNDVYIPEKLYRYRVINNKNCNSLWGEFCESIGKYVHIVWLSHPDKFEDGLDASIRLQLEELEKNSLYQDHINGLTKCVGPDEAERRIGNFNPDANTTYIEGLHELVLSEATAIGMDKPEIHAQTTVQEIQIKLQKEKINLQNRIQSGLAIGCFTITYRSDYMWEHYAMNCTGMCLEYDMTKFQSDEIQRICVFPVYYSDKLPDQSYLLRRATEGYYDTRILQSILTKRTEYHNEHEWRFVMGIIGDEKGVSYPFIKPTTIYLGPNISEDDKNTLLDIGRKLGIRIVSLEKETAPDSYRETICHEPPAFLNRLRVNPPL